MQAKLEFLRSQGDIRGAEGEEWQLDVERKKKAQGGGSQRKRRGGGILGAGGLEDKDMT